ncbi:2067_t:CDS:2 [Acaulospora morrowiae]|uniref:2067_t:CDS:1 n=1 Tax=Acaulospora morrowiae TaxID=94023 RepID=A0A9N9FAY0_9GLOM|nr:2067_t:CDS:2 [Acaulospora morrowiae]
MEFSPILPLFKIQEKKLITLKRAIFLGFFCILLTSLIINALNFGFFYLENFESSLIKTPPNDNSIEIVSNDSQSLIPQPPHPELRDLVIVAGHAIFIGNDFDKVNLENGWILEGFQKGGGFVKIFLEHIRKGVELVVDNKDALLIFSGGQTRPSAGPRSEAQSYWEIAQSLNMFPKEYSSATTEEYARDSYENLAFSICRFREFTGHYPRNITVVGFKFKKRRFIELHRAALKFPIERFNYVGIDPKDKKLFDKDDLYGCRGKLQQKKLHRDPFRRR